MASASMSVPRTALTRLRPGLDNQRLDRPGPHIDDSPGHFASSKLSHQLAALHAATAVIDGSTPRSNRYEDSVTMPKRFEVRRMLVLVKFADSIRISCVRSLISESNPPITPAIATGRSLSAITSISGSRFRSVLSIETIFSPGLALADDDPSAAKQAEIECVQRLTELEHHVVRDVHNVVDRPHAGGNQALAHPLGRVPIFSAADDYADVTAAEIGIFDVDLDGCETSGPGSPRSWARACAPCCPRAAPLRGQRRSSRASRLDWASP